MIYNKLMVGHKQYYVYIMASKPDGVLYTGVTSDLVKRVYEHRTHAVPGFTDKYQVHKLVYFLQAENPESAIVREKQIKRWKRDWKIRLIKEQNPGWRDLYYDLVDEKKIPAYAGMTEEK